MTTPDNAVSPRNLELAKAMVLNTESIIHDWQPLAEQIAQALQAKDDEMKDLVEALEWYESERNYLKGSKGPANVALFGRENFINEDQGKRAREALAKHRGLG